MKRNYNTKLEDANSVNRNTFVSRIFPTAISAHTISSNRGAFLAKKNGQLLLIYVMMIASSSRNEIRVM